MIIPTVIIFHFCFINSKMILNFDLICVVFNFQPGNKAGVGLGSGFRHGLGQESRAVTLENGN